MLIVNMRQIIKFIFYAILKPRLFSSFKRYTFSDEHLKFTHILEGINYLRVADMPKTYLEFGVHSGRTFSAAINASNYLKVQDMSFYAFDSFKRIAQIKKTLMVLSKQVSSKQKLLTGKDCSKKDW